MLLLQYRALLSETEQFHPEFGHLTELPAVMMHLYGPPTACPCRHWSMMVMHVPKLCGSSVAIYCYQWFNKASAMLALLFAN